VIREQTLLRRIKFLTWLFIAGLVLSGATAIPLQTELSWLVRGMHARELIDAAAAPPAWALWLVKVQDALRETGRQYPFLFYGTDWLAFGIS